MQVQQQAYSYRSDGNVPSFPDDRPLLIYDGFCVLCSGFAHFILRFDRHEQILLTASQSDLGRAIYTHYGLHQDDYETNLFLFKGVALQKMDSFLGIMSVLGVPWSLAGIGRILPKNARNWLYDRIARNRYWIFGKHDVCLVTMKDHEHRFLS
ncbi:MAG: DUF393 domain-containing protein [Rhodobiaceae bacterium]|nr:DUF393 domain-containing protein [Rhodobiaceae bacterium]